MVRSIARGCMSIALLLVSGPSQAGWRLDMEGGAMTATSHVEVESHNNTEDLDLGSGGSFAVGGGYRPIELAEVTAQFQGSFSDPAGIVDLLSVYSFTVGGRIFPVSWGRFHPWLTTQIGWYHADADEITIFGAEFDAADDGFGLNAGGGFDVTITPRVSVGLDVRYHRLFDVFDQDFGFLTPMVNVALHFGGGEEPAVK